MLGRSTAGANANVASSLVTSRLPRLRRTNCALDTHSVYQICYPMPSYLGV